MKNSNEALIGLRGFLALSVLIYHIYNSSVLENYIVESPKNSLLYYMNYAGPISVNLFFVISGYLIIKSLVNKRTLREFVLNRILRIYPVFLTIHLIIFGVGPLINYKWMKDISLGQYFIHFFSNLFLLPGIFPFPIAQIVAWSLSYEFAFYLLAGSLFFIYKHAILSFWKYLLYAIFTLICIAIVYLYPNTLFFVVGTVLFVCEKKIKQFYKPYTLFHLNSTLFLILIYLSYGMANFNILIPTLLAFPVFVSLIVGHGLLADFLKLKPFKYLGKISYSLYMWHTFIMFPLKKVMPKIHVFTVSSFLTFLIYAFLTLTLSLLISHLSYQFIEIKLTDYLKSLLAKKKNYKTGVSVVH